MSKFQHGKNQSNTKEGGERWQDLDTEDEDSGNVRWKGKKAPLPVHPPSPAREAPSKAEEILQRIKEAEQLEEVGRSLSSLPIQQLAQMAAEAGPSKSGREEPAGKKLWPTMRGKAPQKKFYGQAK